MLACYFLAPKGLKNGVLLLFSLLFYAWGEPKYVLLMLATIIVFYICGLAMEKAQTPGRKRLWLILSVAVGVGFLAIFKYADFFVESFHRATGIRLPLLRLPLPYLPLQRLPLSYLPLPTLLPAKQPKQRAAQLPYPSTASCYAGGCSRFLPA